MKNHQTSLENAKAKTLVRLETKTAIPDIP
jgi:hypothetical protein